MRIKRCPLGRHPKGVRIAITMGREPRPPVRDGALKSGRHSDPAMGVLMQVSVDAENIFRRRNRAQAFDVARRARSARGSGHARARSMRR